MALILLILLFLIRTKNSISNYLIKENNCDVDIDIDVIDLKIDDDIIYIKYLISETNCIYEYKLEMSDVL